MISMIGFVIIITTINFGIWILLGSADFTIKECLKFAALCELFFISLVVGPCLMLSFSKWRL